MCFNFSFTEVSASKKGDNLTRTCTVSAMVYIGYVIIQTPGTQVQKKCNNSDPGSRRNVIHTLVPEGRQQMVLFTHCQGLGHVSISEYFAS